MVFSGGRPASDQDRREQPESGSLSWGIIFFGLIGAATSTVAASHLRKTVNWVYHQLRLRPGSSSWGSRSDASSTGRNLSEQARKRYNARMHAEYEDEKERMERIRRMQSVFNRERAKRMKAYESWQDQGPSGYQHCPRNDWYWEADTSFKNRTNNFGATSRVPRPSGSYIWSSHYAVLGLDRSREKPYSEDEIKTAFRAKAMECHPDQNQHNKEVAEAKFKEVLKSYEAIKTERKNGERM